MPSALIVLDRNLNISSANRAFYQTFRTSPGETEGCHIYDLGNRQWDIPALRTLLESVIPHRAAVEGFEVEHNFPTIGRRTMLVNARKILRPGDHDGFILLAIEDVSEERTARKESKRNWQLTQSIVDTIRDPLVVLETDMTVVTASKAFLTMFGITIPALRAAGPRKLTFVWARFAGIELYHVSAILAACRTAKSRLPEIFANSFRSFGPSPTRTYARD